MLRISQIKRNAEKGEQGLKRAAAKELRIREEEIQNLRICKRSLDARKKPELYYVYTVDVEVNDEEKILRRCKSNKVTRAKEVIYAPEQSGQFLWKDPGQKMLCLFICLFLVYCKKMLSVHLRKQIERNLHVFLF